MGPGVYSDPALIGGNTVSLCQGLHGDEDHLDDPGIHDVHVCSIMRVQSARATH